MATKISRFKLGLFFLIGLGIIFGGLIWLGASHFFQHFKTYESFFNESVDGLKSGDNVKYRGIDVGQVADIGFARKGNLVRMVLQINPDFNVANKAAQLQIKGITGQQSLDLINAPTDLKEVTPEIDFPHRYPIIPSYPGQMTKIINSLKDVYDKIESLDLQRLVTAWAETGEQATKILSDKDIKKTIANVKHITSDKDIIKAIANLQNITADIKNAVSSLGRPGTPQRWEQNFSNIAHTLAAARKASEALASQVGKIPAGSVGEIAEQIEQTLSQVSRVLVNVKSMVHELKEEPGKVLVIPKSKDPFEK
jgi:ABC-type transporter Mla subunit MlaD